MVGQLHYSGPEYGRMSWQKDVVEESSSGHDRWEAAKQMEGSRERYSP